MAQRQLPKMKQAIRLWQEIQSEKQDAIQRKRGILGNGQGVVRVPGRPDLCYMRINADSTRIWQVLNDRVSDTDGLAVIAEKHPDSDFWEIIDVDKQAISQSGTGLAGVAYRQTHAKTHEWPDYIPGIDAMNVFRRAPVDLRTEPTYADYSLDVYVRPIVYSYQGQTKRFYGDTLSLASYVPTSGIRSVLTYLDVRSNYVYANPGSVVSYAVGAEPESPLIPWYARKSALITLRQNQNVIDEPDIEDVREQSNGLIHNLQAGRVPTVNDDALLGYSEGSLWIYNGTIYICTNPVIGSAVWNELGAGGGNIWPKAGKVNIDDTEYDTITEAATASSSGDTIRVGVGTFTESVDLPEGVNLIGSGRELTIIDATSGGDVLTLYASSTVAELTLKTEYSGAGGVTVAKFDTPTGSPDACYFWIICTISLCRK